MIFSNWNTEEEEDEREEEGVLIKFYDNVENDFYVIDVSKGFYESK